MARFKTYGSINGVEGSVLNTPFVPGTSQLNVGSSATPTSRYNTDGNSIGSSSFSSRGNNVSEIGLTVAQKVMSSAPYIQAFQLFSQLSDKTWLQRLQAIPYSVDDANSTFIDSLGLSNNFEDKQDANYQYCMEQISALLAEYQSWNNSLPITQSQQFADAGINSAITGQGINSSSIPNVGVSTDPSTLQSTNVGDFILDASRFILDSASGLASITYQFLNLGLQKSSQWLDFKKYLRDEGISMQSDKEYYSLPSLLRGLRKGEPIIFSDPKGDKIRTEQIVDKLLTNDNFAPLLKRWYLEPHELDSDISRHTELGGMFGLEYQEQNPSFIGVDAVTEAEYQKFLVGLKRDYLQNKLSLKISDNTLDLQEKDKLIKSNQSELHKLDIEELQIKLNLIKSLRDSGNIADKLLLQKVLLGFNETEQTLLSYSESFYEAKEYVGLFSSILGAIF